MTTISIYQNVRNENKFLEIHNDGHYHNIVRQYLEWPNGVKHLVGDRMFHRWKKNNLRELLEEYFLVRQTQAQ